MRAVLHSLTLALLATLAGAAAARVPAPAVAVSPAATASADAATGVPAATDAAAVPAAAPAAPPTPEGADPDALRAGRDAAFAAFRREFEAKRWTDALPHAQRVVELTERLGATTELPAALNNLGTTYLQLPDPLAAERVYARSLQLVEESQGSTSRRLVSPLRGLANAYAATGRRDLAIAPLERALAILRRADGLFDPGQVPLLESLTESYVQQARWQDAEQAHLYQFRLAERRYGSTPKLVPALSRLAKWYEDTGRYGQARRTWARQYRIATPRGETDVGGAVNALRGMARSYRLEYQYGPEVLEPDEIARADGLAFRMDATERDPFGRRIVTPGATDYRLDPAGREFLQAALQMIERLDPPSPAATATLLVELGDWTLLAERAAQALPYWERAWRLLPAESGSAEAPPRNPLLYPAQLLYRPPSAARRHAGLPPEAVVERAAVAEFTVAEDGRVRDLRIVEGDASEAQRNSLVSALNRALYRPRFVDGRPVATENVRYRETFRVARSADEAADAAPAAAGEAAAPAASGDAAGERPAPGPEPPGA